MLRLRQSFLGDLGAYKVVVRTPDAETSFQEETLEEARDRAKFERQREGAEVAILDPDGDPVGGGPGKLLVVGAVAAAVVAVPLLFSR